MQHFVSMIPAFLNKPLRLTFETSGQPKLYGFKLNGLDGLGALRVISRPRRQPSLAELLQNRLIPERPIVDAVATDRDPLLERITLDRG